MNGKKIHIKNIIILIVIIMLIGIGISITMSRYKSTGQTDLNTAIAFFVVEDTYQEGNIFLDDLYPRDEAFNYQFTVANTDGTNTADTSIEYTIEMEITTNLPLQFNIYKDNSKLTSTDDIENYVTLDYTNETYIRKIKIKNGNFTFGEEKTDIYKIEVIFPKTYSQYEEFEGMIDNVNLKLDAKQKID